MRISLICFTAHTECEGALGMENGAISDHQICAASEYENNMHHKAFQGRLRFEPTPSEAGSWSAEINNANQWLQVDLGTPHTRITGVATEVRTDMNQWVTKYKLRYRDNSTAFQYY